ncbi:MAG: PGPGW domain-containing protein [Actinomycetes bacterium]
MPASAQDLRQRVDHFRERSQETYTRHGRLFRVGWTIAAFVVLLGGLAMTVLPGPAVVAVPLGLAMLSLRFTWASRLVDVGLDKGTEAADWVQSSRLRQLLLLTAAALCLAGAVGACLWLS